MVNEAAGNVAGQIGNKFAADEQANAGRGAIDQKTGHVDQAMLEHSAAYRRAIELGREQTGFTTALEEYQHVLAGTLEHQTSADLDARRAEADEDIDAFLQSYARDPETGDIRSDLSTKEARHWLGTAMGDARQRLTAAAHARIDERFKGESLTNLGNLASAQLDTGTLDIAALRKVLPPIVSDDEIRGTILTTFMAKSEQLKANGRFADSYRIVNQLLGGTAATAAAPPLTAVGTPPTGAPKSPSVARRRSRDDVIGFVLNTLEGGAVVVDNRDGGGTTKFGITKRHNPDVDVANLTFGQAKGIAQSGYWQDAYNDANPAVAAIAFDAGFINSKSFGREIATRFANDPVGALGAYRARLQDIATKPEKARFLTAWMNRVDKLGTYLGVGPGGASSDNVIDDPTFMRDDAPLDPVEEARRTPGASFASQLTGGLALRPEERTKLLEYRDQLGREVKQEWQRKTAAKQEETGSEFLLRLSGLGNPVTPIEIAEAARRREITPEQTSQLLNVIRSDADRDAARAERAADAAERDRDKADEQAAQGITASLMGPVYSGQRSTGDALRLFGERASGLDPKVRRAVLGAITAEANGIEEVRKNNPELRFATDAFDDQEQEALRRIRGPYRDPRTGRAVTAEQQRAIVSLEFAKAKRALFQSAVDKGNIGNLPDQLGKTIASRIRPYLTTPAGRR
jgi:hypothetical protein